jgi:uncharacterized protein
MKFNLDQPAGRLLVRAYGPDGLRVGDQTWSRSVVLTPDGAVHDWRPGSFDDLTADDLASLVTLEPEVLLLGSGSRQRFPERVVLAPLYVARIGFEIMDSGAACRTYNLLAAEGRRVAAAVIVERRG